ncbi:sensor histidine kinase [Glycocaulis sp.]|uniref:sensor histidine kinase n=1 Tax=Glycocaulis sp. TaxID=1969725 RepID=UPI003D1EFAD2
MMTLAARLGSWIARTRARWIHALWATLWLGSGLTAFLLGASFETGALIAATGLPGLVGLRLARAGSWSDTARAFIVVSWAVPVLTLAALPGAMAGLAVLAALAGAAALSASRQYGAALVSLLANSASLAIMVYAGAVELAAFGLPVSMELALGAYLGLAGLIALAGLLPRLSHEKRDNAQLQPLAAGFVNAPSALIVCDGDGHMQAMSRAARDLLPGLPRDIDGLPVSHLAYEDEGRDLLERQLRHASGSIVTEMRGAGGRPVSLEARAHRADGGFVVALSVPRREDRLLDRLARERDEAVAASKAKSEFLAAISHELRTPLNAIIGFSDLMKQRLFGPMPARYAEYADLIHESGVHLLDLIGDVLDMSKIEADRYELIRETFDAGEVVETCVRMMRLRAEDKNIRLSCDLRQSAVMVDADRKALRQIVLNLLSNAIKFTPDGGAVVVMLRASGAELVLAVGDSGPGMSEEDVSRLGQAYAQAANAHQSDERGSGLGLALVHALAGLHDGSMSLQSRLGEGTTVTVTLPVVQAGDDGILHSEPEPPAIHEQIRLAQAAGEAIVQQAAAS